jgi:hypothetical protein
MFGMSGISFIFGIWWERWRKAEKQVFSEIWNGEGQNWFE